MFQESLATWIVTGIIWITLFWSSDTEMTNTDAIIGWSKIRMANGGARMVIWGFQEMDGMHVAFHRLLHIL